MRTTLHLLQRPTALRCVWVEQKTDSGTRLISVWLTETARRDTCFSAESLVPIDDPPAIAA